MRAGAEEGHRRARPDRRGLQGPRRDRRQRRGMRVAPEGRRPAGAGGRRQRAARRARSAGRPERARNASRLPGRLPPRPRAGRSRRATLAARLDPGPRARSSRPSRRSAAAAPGSTTSSSRRPPPSSGTRKAANVSATGADAYASANPGCLVQVVAYLRKTDARLPALHPVEILDASIRGTSGTSCSARPSLGTGFSLSRLSAVVALPRTRGQAEA